MAIREHNGGVSTRSLKPFASLGRFIVFCWELGVVHSERLLPVAVTILKEAQTLICNLKKAALLGWALPTEVNTSSWLFLIKAPHCN